MAHKTWQKIASKNRQNKLQKLTAFCIHLQHQKQLKKSVTISAAEIIYHLKLWDELETCKITLEDHELYPFIKSGQDITDVLQDFIRMKGEALESYLNLTGNISPN